MATLQQDENNALYQIKAFIPGMIKVNDKEIFKSIIITPNELIEDTLPESIHMLSASALEKFLDIKPAILLIGTGSTHVLLSPETYGFLMNAGIGVEVMSTSAACRTYNALSAEGRNVAAALIIK